jgi:hypothetical protein
MSLVDRAKARVGRVKADRSTVLGVAGHKATMGALGKAAGWKRVTTAADSMEYAVPTTESNVDKKSFPVGGMSVNKIEPGTVSRHKPTEDF